MSTYLLFIYNFELSAIKCCNIYGIYIFSSAHLIFSEKIFIFAFMIDFSLMPTLPIIALLAVLSLLAVLIHPQLRKIRTHEADIISEPIEPLTIVIAVHDNAKALQHHLPNILQQQYPHFQVIVVSEKGDSETEDVLKRLQSRFSHLYYTLIPDSSRYMSRRKLQITLGVKAAKTEWIVLIDATCCPDSSLWLKTMAQHCTPHCDFVMGSTHFDETSTPSHYRYEHFWQAYRWLYQAQQSEPYITNMPNICFRKSLFMQHEGFRGNLHLVRGEYAFMVNQYALRGATAIEWSPESRMTEDCPSSKTWLNRHLQQLAARSSLHGTTLVLWSQRLDLLLPHMSTCLCIIIAVLGGYNGNWLLAGTAIGCCLATWFFRSTITVVAAKRLGFYFPFWQLPFLDGSQIFRHIAYRWKYWRSDHNDFTTHKL